MSQYKINTKVASVELKKRVTGHRRTGEVDQMGKPIYEAIEETLGWFVNFEGSWESLYLGPDKPKAVPGQSAVIRVEFL